MAVGTISGTAFSDRHAFRFAALDLTLDQAKRHTTSSTLKLVPLNGGRARALGTLPGMSVSGLSVSPDFSRVLYARCDLCEADIMLVENFK